MSREIKFRAWNLTYKWMEDSFFISSGGVAYDVPSKTFDTPNTEIEEAPDYVLMQFTGLRDVNGVEIYEGDLFEAVLQYARTSKLIRCDNLPSRRYLFEVAWSANRCSFGLRCLTEPLQSTGNNTNLEDAYTKGAPTLRDVGGLKVIGNIYEHPHLLDEAK